MPRKENMIEDVLDGHETDIEGWVLRDKDSLRTWLRSILGLDKMTKNQIRKSFGVYLSEEE